MDELEEQIERIVSNYDEPPITRLTLKAVSCDAYKAGMEATQNIYKS